MMKEIKEINRKIWYGIGAFIIICFVIVGISFNKVNTDAKETQVKQEKEQEPVSGYDLVEMLQGQEIHKQAEIIAYNLSKKVYEEDYVRASINLDKNLMVLFDLPFYDTDKDTIEIASLFTDTLFAWLRLMLELNPSSINSVETVNIGFLATFIDEQGNEFEKIALGFNAYTNKLLSTDLDNLSYENLDQLCYEIKLDPAFNLKY